MSLFYCNVLSTGRQVGYFNVSPVTTPHHPATVTKKLVEDGRRPQFFLNRGPQFFDNLRLPQIF